MVGLRKSLREYQNLWPVGSILGSTLVVDMETIRKNDFGTIMVAVLNPLLILARMDVVIEDHYFELEFEVESKGFAENGEEVEVNWNREVDDKREEEESPEQNSSDKRDPKRQKGTGRFVARGDLS